MGAGAAARRGSSRAITHRTLPIPTVMKPRYTGQEREGRGFSLGELREAGLTPERAKQMGLRVDPRRGSVHEKNVGALRALLKPRRGKRARPAKKAGEGAPRRGRRRATGEG